jgi:hypothetical protein
VLSIAIVEILFRKIIGSDLKKFGTKLLCSQWRERERERERGGYVSDGAQFLSVN